MCVHEQMDSPSTSERSRQWGRNSCDFLWQQTDSAIDLSSAMRKKRAESITLCVCMCVCVREDGGQEVIRELYSESASALDSCEAMLRDDCFI